MGAREELEQIIRDSTPDELFCYAVIAAAIKGRKPCAGGGHSKGFFKRAIKRMRAVQAADSEHWETWEDAIQIIRREWLNPCAENAPKQPK